MSTRSVICKANSNGTINGIYCHNDGYIKGAGETLFKHYQDQKKINALIGGGDISTLGSRLDATVFFHRDRGEKLNHWSGATIQELIEKMGVKGIEYVYMFNKEWFVSPDASYKDNKFKPLANFFNGSKENERQNKDTESRNQTKIFAVGRILNQQNKLVGLVLSNGTQQKQYYLAQCITFADKGQLKNVKAVTRNDKTFLVGKNGTSLEALPYVYANA